MTRRAKDALPYLLAAALGLVVAAVAWHRLDAAGSARHRLGVTWAAPGALALLAACPLVAWLGIHRRRARAPTLAHTRAAELARIPPGVVGRLAALPEVLRVVAVGLLACALARPQTLAVERQDTESVDIALVLDLSRSMEERDLRASRLDAAQRTIRQFLRGLDCRFARRPLASGSPLAGRACGDRVSLVAFAQAPMLRCPLTTDYDALDQIVAGLSIGDVPELGTAIGDALALALGSMRRSDARSRIAVLLSDGDSNWVTEFTPREAEALAVDMGVRVFTILVGRERGGPARRYDVNPALLEGIAARTGGRFFRAPDGDALAASFAAVRAELDKTPREVVSETRTVELFGVLLVPALVLLGLERLLRLTRWRRFP